MDHDLIISDWYNTHSSVAWLNNNDRAFIRLLHSFQPKKKSFYALCYFVLGIIKLHTINGIIWFFNILVLAQEQRIGMEAGSRSRKTDILSLRGLHLWFNRQRKWAISIAPEILHRLQIVIFLLQTIDSKKKRFIWTWKIKRNNQSAYLDFRKIGMLS